MTHEHFLFSPGNWIGEGKINFSKTSEFLKFYTRWQIEENTEAKNNNLKGFQFVEIQGGDDHIQNQYDIFNITPESFEITLENELVSLVKGTGVIDEKKVAWEFRGHPNFEGYEVYQLQDNGDYLFHAEYVSPDHLRSIIEGRIWKKEKK